LSLVFFTDRDLGTRFPEILAAAGLKVERHRDHFAPDCADEEWLKAIGERGWIAVPHDGRIRYKPNELDAVVRHRVTLLVVIGKAPFPVLARNFVATAHKFPTFLAQHKPPLIAKVYRPSPGDLAKNPDAAGELVRWFPR
jgi:PIN like domain